MIQETLMQWQHGYIRSKAKYKGLIAGRRAGKTHAIQCEIVDDALGHNNFRSFYLTPDGVLCNEVFRELKESPDLQSRILRIEMQPVRQIFWITGSVTMFRMFDRPDRSVGLGLDRVYFDEIQKLEGMGGEADFMRVIRPLIMDRGGSLTVAGQWRGVGCWWYKFFQKNKDNPQYALWNVPSWEGYRFRHGKENHPEIVAARESMPRIMYEQEIACIPTANSNAAFIYEDLVSCTGGSELTNPERGHRYVIGVDLGRSRDPSAWVIIDVTQKPFQVVYAETRPIGERHETGAFELARLSQRFGGARVIIDATGGATGGKHDFDAFTKLYRAKIRNLRHIYFTKTKKTAMVQELSLGIEQNELKIPQTCKNLFDQLRSYEYKYDSWGGYSYQGPGGHEDDLVIALVLAWQGTRDSSQSGSMGAAQAALMG